MYVRGLCIFLDVRHGSHVVQGALGSGVARSVACRVRVQCALKFDRFIRGPSRPARARTSPMHPGSGGVGLIQAGIDLARLALWLGGMGYARALRISLCVVDVCMVQHPAGVSSTLCIDVV